MTRGLKLRAYGFGGEGSRVVGERLLLVDSIRSIIAKNERIKDRKERTESSLCT